MVTDDRTKTAEGLLDLIGNIDTQQIHWELKKLQAIKEWALRKIGIDYRIGDRVEVVDRFTTREDYRECTQPGALAVVRDIDFNPYSFDGDGAWHAHVVLDREWSTGMKDKDGVPQKRWWSGPAAELPEGMELSHRLPGENDRRHLFTPLATSLRKHVPEPERCDCCGQATP